VVKSIEEKNYLK